jgi:hypothetical protein
MGAIAWNGDILQMSRLETGLGLQPGLELGSGTVARSILSRLNNTNKNTNPNTKSYPDLITES